MNDPHVEALIYILDTSPNVTYDQPPPLDIDQKEFTARLEAGQLTCRMKEHFPSIAAARDVVDRYLRSWEIDADMKCGRGEIRFVYKNAQVIDRNPPQKGENLVIEAQGISLAISTSSVTLHVTRRNYPEPPISFRVSPDVETLWHRFQGYLDGKEPLLAMAYFSYTIILRIAGNKKNASKIFAIDTDVIRKLSELSSTRGDDKIARKAKITSLPLNSNEKAWLEAVVLLLVRRIGEYGQVYPSPLIKMFTLPSL